MTARALIAFASVLAACSSPLPADSRDAAHDDASALDAAEPSDASSLDAHVWGDASDADAGASESDGAATEFDAGTTSTDDAGSEIDAGSHDGGALDAAIRDADAGASEPDASWLEPDAGDLDAGAMEEDAGASDGGPQDAGASEPDAGPPDAGPPDAGHDAGPPPCLADAWEPNNTQATARLLATCTTNAGAWNVDATFSGADSDWFRIDVRRTTTRPTRVRASTPPGATAWLRIRYVCDSGAPTCSGGTRVGNACEAVALSFVVLVASCPDPSAAATFYVEATRPSLAACGYSPTFELEPG